MSECLRLAAFVVLPIVLSGCGIVNGATGGAFCSPFVIGGCGSSDDFLDAELQPKPEPTESLEFTQTTAALEADRVDFEIALPLEYPGRREMIIIVAPGSSGCLDEEVSIVGAAFDAGIAVVRIEPEDGANSLDIAWAGLQAEEFGAGANDSLTSVVVEGNQFDAIDGSRIGDSSFARLLLLSPFSEREYGAVQDVHPNPTRIIATDAEATGVFLSTLVDATAWDLVTFDSALSGCDLASSADEPAGGGTPASAETRLFLGIPPADGGA